ncbi:MAG TPA: helix-hairpin-helix domain-containing protein [Methylomirabilota bacterium]|jgi:competence ComEA-like helix-hairpin-helix protein|nr:helix-hairpin-helix domain-containing protein [Methylomirabilota bacterium]
MKAIGWIGTLAVATWCLGSTVAGAAGDKPAKADSPSEGQAQPHEAKPHVNDGKGHAAESKAHAKGEGRVNINEASKADLMKLDGISAGVAQKIIAYRHAHGPFKKAHDLEKVDGVGKDVVERNVGRISVK